MGFLVRSLESHGPCVDSFLWGNNEHCPEEGHFAGIPGIGCEAELVLSDFSDFDSKGIEFLGPLNTGEEDGCSWDVIERLVVSDWIVFLPLFLIAWGQGSALVGFKFVDINVGVKERGIINGDSVERPRGNSGVLESEHLQLDVDDFNVESWWLALGEILVGGSDNDFGEVKERLVESNGDKNISRDAGFLLQSMIGYLGPMDWIVHTELVLNPFKAKCCYYEAEC